MNKLNIYHEESNLSGSLWNYIQDTATVELLSTEYLYISHDTKPVNNFYIEIKTPNEETSVISIEYYDGSAWKYISNINDETNGLTRSGFLTFERVDAEKVEVNSIEKHWLRLSVDADTSEVEINGINIVFSNDIDLKEELPEYADYLPVGETTFIGRHQSAKRDIIQSLRNVGNTKKLEGNFISTDIDEYDILNPLQFRQASKYLVLSKIFFNISDEVDDKYSEKSKSYFELYRKAFDLCLMDIDSNDNGKLETFENKKNYLLIERI